MKSEMGIPDIIRLDYTLVAWLNLATTGKPTEVQLKGVATMYVFAIAEDKKNSFSGYS